MSAQQGLPTHDGAGDDSNDDQSRPGSRAGSFELPDLGSQSVLFLKLCSA